MTAKPRWFQTTAIDYPNSRPHIGTAFEKVGADVQARYRRMEGYDVCFLMGNDENTVKVSKRAAELRLDPQAYCDDEFSLEAIHAGDVRVLEPQEDPDRPEQHHPDREHW